MKLVRLKNQFIYEQLALEEALLRATTDEWCVVNTGSKPAIVMGISGIQNELVHPNNLPNIRRFTGGGCVVVDEETIFVTFIGNMDAPTPAKIHARIQEYLEPVFKNLPFSLKENDYLLNERKIGGNAQAITKGRFLHHTSFLYRYDPAKMALLKMPKKTPVYRQGRDHQEFVSTLSPFFAQKESFFSKLIENLSIKEEPSHKEIQKILSLPHRKALTYI